MTALGRGTGWTLQGVSQVMLPVFHSRMAAGRAVLVLGKLSQHLALQCEHLGAPCLSSVVTLQGETGERVCGERPCLTTWMMPGLGTCNLSLHFAVFIKLDKHQHSTPGMWWDLWGLLGRFLMGVVPRELAVTGEGASTGVCTRSENQVLSHLTVSLQQWLNTSV